MSGLNDGVNGVTCRHPSCYTTHGHAIQGRNLMRNAMRIVLWALAGFVTIGPASAQTWPSRPVTVVVPFAAGSSTDTAARILSVGMSEALGQQVIVENIG